ncbi:porin family protein [Maribellus sp. YY47]|uniref:porin family protein n=1 Tax=Maribellus sp. YY47 TaxID=2929486 RepID=UPI002001623D|nr:porin family protein [Maribellus sp. YY47]MCK3684293.1 porin family protein [Maribellus sp. YY47]
MKKLCLLLFALVVSLAAFPQADKGFIYLKNGTILKGKYSYSSDQKNVSVFTAGNLWVFSRSEIDTIAAKRVGDCRSAKPLMPDSKFFYRIELGVLVGNSDNSQNAPFSMTGSINYRINPHFSAGLGTGIEFLKESFLPVFVNFEYKLHQYPSSPYFFLKTGYQVPIEESNAVYYDVVPDWISYWPWPGTSGTQSLDSKGGFLINPGIGYQHMFSPSFGMNFAVGYQYHRLNYSGENDYELDIDYNRLTVKLGIIFN